MLEFREHNGRHRRAGWDTSHLLIEPPAPGTTGTTGSKYGIKTATETTAHAE